jgi:hypothetical protein
MDSFPVKTSPEGQSYVGIQSIVVFWVELLPIQINHLRTDKDLDLEFFKPNN